MEGAEYFVHFDASYEFHLEKFTWERKLEIKLFQLVRVHCKDQWSLLADRKILEFTHAISCIHRTSFIDSLLHRGFCRCPCISTKACTQVLDKGYLKCHIILGEINSKIFQSSCVQRVQPTNLVPAYLKLDEAYVAAVHMFEQRTPQDWKLMLSTYTSIQISDAQCKCLRSAPFLFSKWAVEAGSRQENTDISKSQPDNHSSNLPGLQGTRGNFQGRRGVITVSLSLPSSRKASSTTSSTSASTVTVLAMATYPSLSSSRFPSATTTISTGSSLATTTTTLTKSTPFSATTVTLTKSGNIECNGTQVVFDGVGLGSSRVSRRDGC